MHLPYLTLILTLALISCAPPSNDEDTSQEPSPSTSGRVADGYLVGATVCLDTNKNLHCDAQEPSTITTAGGQFEFSLLDNALFSQYAIVVEVTPYTVDEDTNKNVVTAYTLSAPIGQTAFISPITTLIYHTQRNNIGFTEKQARDFVRNLLHLSEGFDLYSDYVLNKNLLKDSYPTAYGIAQTIARLMAKNKAVLLKSYKNVPSSDELKAIENIVNAKVLSRLETISFKVKSLIQESDDGSLTITQAEDLAQSEFILFNSSLSSENANALISSELAKANSVFQISTQSAVDFFKIERSIYQMHYLYTINQLSADLSQNIQIIEQVFTTSSLIAPKTIYSSYCGSSTALLDCPSTVDLNSAVDFNYEVTTNGNDIKLLVDNNQNQSSDIYSVFLYQNAADDILVTNTSTVPLSTSINLRSLINYEGALYLTETLKDEITVDFTEGDELYVITLLGTRKHLPSTINYNDICGIDGALCHKPIDTYSTIQIGIDAYLSSLPQANNPMALKGLPYLYWISDDKLNWHYCKTLDRMSCSSNVKTEASFYMLNTTKTNDYDQYLVISDFVEYIYSNFEYKTAEVIFESGTNKLTRRYYIEPKTYSHSVTYFNRSAMDKIINSLKSYSHATPTLQKKLTAEDFLLNNELIFSLETLSSTNPPQTTLSFFDPISSTLKFTDCNNLQLNCSTIPPNGYYDLRINNDATVSIESNGQPLSIINSVTRQKLVGTLNYQNLFQNSGTTNPYPQLNHTVVFDVGDIRYDFEIILPGTNSQTVINTTFNESAIKKIIESINIQLNL